MTIMLACILWIWTWLVAPALASPADWATHALRLSGESSEVRTEALRSLRRTTGLQETLIRELSGPRRPLALDAIVALGLKDCLPELSRLSRKDEEGSIYLAMNALIDSVNREGFIELYRTRLGEKGISMPAQAILLDTLGRLGAELEPGQVSGFLESADYEVRRSALYYARLMILRHGKKRYVEIAERARSGAPRQLRAQAEALLAEMGGGK